LAQAQQIKGMQQQQKMAELQMDAYQRQQERDAKTQQLRARDIQSGGGASDELMAMDPEGATKTNQALQARQAFRAYSMAQGVANAQTPEQVAELALRFGRTPEQAQAAAANFAADPDGYRREAGMSALDIKDRFAQQNSDRTFNAGRQDARISQANQAAQLRISQGNADLARQRLAHDKRKDMGSPGGFGSNGITPEMYNVVLSYTQKKQDGIPTTPAEDRRYALAYSVLSRPARFTTPDGTMMEQAPIDLSPFPQPGQAARNPAAGGSAEVPQVPQVPQQPAQTDVPGVADARNLGRKPLNMSDATKLAGIQSGYENIKRFQSELFREDGSLNRPLLAGMATGVRDGGWRARMRDAIDAQLRAESGAAVPDTEVDRAMERFVPSVTDGPERAKAKLDLLMGRFDRTFRNMQIAPPETSGGGEGSGLSDEVNDLLDKWAPQ
jgi:hypothetical protein